MEPKGTATRRDFLKTSAAAGAAVVAGGLASGSARGRAAPLRVGVVGCGGRGTGAVVQALRADEGAVLWAMGDAFGDRIETCLGHARDALPETPDRIEVPGERRFAGFDAYREVIDSGVDVLLLTTPPAFRPEHLAASVDSG
jgi:Predicted dehydrogenases and related proteins